MFIPFLPFTGPLRRRDGGGHVGCAVDRRVVDLTRAAVIRVRQPDSLPIECLLCSPAAHPGVSGHDASMGDPGARAIVQIAEGHYVIRDSWSRAGRGIQTSR
jgi:hypothetical protein